jgi:hypothetical protein
VTYDEFWQERAAAENIDKIRMPIFSIGVWTKVDLVDLHLNGNIVGLQRAAAPKKLLIFGSSMLFAAVGDFSSVAFHAQYLRPFYGWCLKGEQATYLAEPPVCYFEARRFGCGQAGGRFRTDSAVITLQLIGKLLEVPCYVSRLDPDLQHRLSGSVGPGAFEPLAMRANDFPEVSSDPEDLIFRTSGPTHAELVNLGRGLEGVRLVTAADYLVQVRVSTGKFAMILDHLFCRVCDNLQNMALFLERLQSSDNIWVRT